MTSFNTLNNLKTKKIRVGRGIGSGKGKTSGVKCHCTEDYLKEVSTL